MYSPYKDEKLKTEYDEDEHINLSQLSCELRYDLSYPRTSCKRTHRYLVECDLGSKHYTFGQYFYYKTNQDIKYPFVFLRQTPDYSIKPEAPKA